MAPSGRVRCTWFERGRRCDLPPTRPHYDERTGNLFAFLCMAHEHELEKAVKTGTAPQIRAAFQKAGGRKK
jgi:hypothetical protein